MLKKIAILFLMISVYTFSEVRDGINLFTKEERITLTKEIEALEEEHKIKIYILTLDSNGEKQTEGPDKSIIINIEKEGDKKISVSIIFSQDLGMAEKEEDLNSLIDSLSNQLLEKEYYSYVKELLDNVIKSYMPEDESSIDEESFLHYYKWKIIKWTVIILTILNILVRIRRVEKEKRERAVLKKNK